MEFVIIKKEQDWENCETGIVEFAGGILDMEYETFARDIERLEFSKRSDVLYDMPIGMAIIRGGNELEIETVNREFLRQEGYTREELRESGVPYTDYIYGEDVGVFEDMIEQCKERKSTETMELRMQTKDGGVRWEMVQCKLYCYRDAVPYYILTSWDMEEHKRKEEERRIREERRIQDQISEEARLDPQTKILNKVAVCEEVDKFLAQKPQGEHVLFLIDIDDFKRINDTFGHTVGDTVISDVAQIIREQFAESDFVARVGGDEFVAFMKHTTLELAEEQAKKLGKEASKRLIGDDAIVNVTLSIGLATYGVDGDDYESLFTMADRAMYRTKGNGKNNYSVASKEKDFETRQPKSEREERRPEGQIADKEFLNFAFSLLSHARDINGSLNVLIEQIGKRYGLDSVSVFEHLEDRREMFLMNYWNRYGYVYEKRVFPRIMDSFENAVPGEFVSMSQEEISKSEQEGMENWKNCSPIQHLAGIKFEFSGNRIGGLYLGVSNRDGFTQEEESTFCELSRVVSVFISLRNKIYDDQREIRQLQNQDMLTGLYNMEAFRRREEERIYKGELLGDAAKGEIYALVHVDVNNFSYVNENFGQQVGDNILQEFARMLLKEEHVSEACRMYSDYFIELVHGQTEEEIYRKVLDENRAFEAMQKVRYPASDMRLSAGICFIRDKNEGFDAILEGANLARKFAKEHKGNGVAIYREDMRAKREDAFHITGRFYGALQKGEFEVFLQPKFRLKEKTIYGAEALARWRTQSGELISPGRFIPPLEDMGYIVDLDFYILEQLLRTMRRWKDAGKKLFTISTNFSRRHFESDGVEFLQRLQELMDRYQIEPRYIEIEVTEGVVAENLDGLKQCMSKLEELGYRIAIDDFGTGYSSLSMLLEIPANVIKIDKSFTDRINQKGQREFVTRMGKFIGAVKEEIVFEGIEEETQCEFLLDCGFHYGQGYLFDKPLSLGEFERKYI